MRDIITKKPAIRVYDNGGKTADRYTVYYLTPQYFHGEKFYIYIGMSAYPTHPQGIGEHGEVSSSQLPRHKYHRGIGKRIEFADLPVDCQTVVNRELEVIK